MPSSVTRLDDFLVHGRLFKACGDKCLALIAHILGLLLIKCYFSSKIVFGLHFKYFGRFLLEPSGHTGAK